MNGTAGYCFGAPFIMESIAKDWVTAGRVNSKDGWSALTAKHSGAFGHPAVLKDHHFRNMKSQ